MTKENKQAILDDSGLIEIRFSYNPNIITQIKQIPGRKWTPKSKTWTAPLSKKNVDLLTEFGFDIDEKLTKRLENNLLPQPNWDLLPGGLYDFQKEGIKFIEKHGGRALIADEMGLGKTVQSLGWMAIHPEIRPSVVLCPATIKFKWEKEIYTWIGEANAQICSGRVPEIDKNADVFIINYDILPDWIEVLEQQNPQFLVIDETQYVKGRATKRTKATRYFAKSIPFIVGLTGTPIVNRPLEFFTILNILDPVNWFSFWNYVQEYCGATKKTIWNNKIKKKISAWDFTGATNTKKLHTIVSSTLMLRRLKKDVLKQLPPKTRVVIPLEIKNSDSYKQAWKEYQQWLKEGTKGTQLEHRNQLEKLKQLAVKGKMDQALEWIHDFLEENNKLVVFAWHIEIIKLLQDKLKEYNPATIFGETPTNQRAEIANKFQTSPECRVFIGNIKSAGTGIDLFAASAVVFLELVWTPGDHEQAESRIHRIGQEAENITAYYLVAKDTVEEDIAAVLDEKQKILTQVLDGKEVKEESLLQELIKKSYSPKQRNIKKDTPQKEIKSVTKKIEVDDLDDFNAPPQRPQQEQHIYKPTETAVTEKICMGLFILFVCLVIGSCAA